MEVVIDPWLGPWQMVYFDGKLRAGSIAVVESALYWASRRPWWKRLLAELEPVEPLVPPPSPSWLAAWSSPPPYRFSTFDNWGLT